MEELSAAWSSDATACRRSRYRFTIRNPGGRWPSICGKRRSSPVATEWVTKVRVVVRIHY